MLFQASNLAAGEHSITIRSETGTNSTVYFAIDYAQVFMPSSGDSRYAQCYFGVATVIKTLQSGLSVAQIVGIVVGSVCGLLLLAAVVLLFRSKRGKYFLLRKKQDDSDHRSESLVIEPFSDLQTPPATSPLYDTQVFTPQNLKGQLSHGTMTQRYSQQDHPMTATVRGSMWTLLCWKQLIIPSFLRHFQERIYISNPNWLHSLCHLLAYSPANLQHARRVFWTRRGDLFRSRLGSRCLRWRSPHRFRQSYLSQLLKNLRLFISNDFWLLHGLRVLYFSYCLNFVVYLRIGRCDRHATPFTKTRIYVLRPTT